jgi:hypothetical protein
MPVVIRLIITAALHCGCIARTLVVLDLIITYYLMSQSA